MAIVTQAIARYLTRAQYDELIRERDEARAQRDIAQSHVVSLRKALAAAIRRERTVGGYCSHEDQQARRDAEALIVETGGKP